MVCIAFLLTPCAFWGGMPPEFCRTQWPCRDECFKNRTLASWIFKKTYFLWATLALDASWGEGKSSCWNKCHCFSQWVRVTCLHQWAAGLAHPLSFTVSPSSVLWNWTLFWGCKLQWNMWGDAFACSLIYLTTFFFYLRKSLFILRYSHLYLHAKLYVALR